MDDPLLRIFAGDRMKAIMDKLGVPRGEPIEAGMVSRSIESAQRKVENRNFEIRKQLLDYDNVANEQRKIIYAQRNEILEVEDPIELVTRLRDGAMEAMVRSYVPHESIEEQWDLPGLQAELQKVYGLAIDLQAVVESQEELDDAGVVALVAKAATDLYTAKWETVGRTAFSGFERSVLIQHLDHAWREHLAALDLLRQGIHLRGYAQKDPKQEYKREAFTLFEQLLERVRDSVTRLLMNVEVQTQEQAEAAAREAQERAAALTASQMQFTHADFSPEASFSAEDPQALALAAQEASSPAPPSAPASVGSSAAASPSAFPKVGRNDPCPCGSGKKYKHCHGLIQ
jgi:preprotein translocase subunit SecA